MAVIYNFIFRTVDTFSGCSGLTSVTIPNSITSIGGSAFTGCSGLNSVNISDIAVWCNIKFYSDVSNPLYYAHHLYLNGIEVKDLVIPNSVTSIGNYSFSGCSGLTSVTIPNSVTSIGSYAFSSCSGLTSVTIPNSVTSIGGGVFSGCSGLTSVTIPNSVTSIGIFAFSGCRGLTSVTIPNSITFIGDYAFQDCSGLTSMTIPNNVTSIGIFAFRDCSSLTSVTIPNSMTSIGNGAFYGCTSIQFIKSYITEPYSINKYVFPDDVYRSATLYVPAGTEKLYSRYDGWREFLKIEEMDESEQPEIPGADKCATPTIKYENGKLSFSCQTEGVEYKYKIEANDAKEGFGNNIQMTKTYRVTVYAFKDGMNNSDPAIANISIAGGKDGDVNGDGVVDAADVVKVTNIIMGK